MTYKLLHPLICSTNSSALWGSHNYYEEINVVKIFRCRYCHCTYKSTDVGVCVYCGASLTAPEMEKNDE
jgi:hypothetical protein